jgi:predicted permease
MVTETLLLTLFGAGAGLVLGLWTSNALAAIRLPGDLPVRFDFRLDGRVLVYTAALSLLTSLVVGVASAIRVAGADAMHVLRGARRLLPAHPHRIRGFLVLSQISCCIVLLSVAGVFVRSLFEARRADLGFRPEGVLNFQMDVGQLGYTETRGRAFFADVERQIRSIPGVRYASFAFTVPMGYVRASASVEAEGQAVDRDSRIVAGTNMVSAEYFETMGIPIVRGRRINDADDEHSPPVAVVNQRLADVLWPGQDPVGRRMRSDGRSIEVVGVARTGKYQFLFEEPQPYVYVPIAQAYSGLRVLQICASAPLDVVGPAVERAIRALEPNLTLYDVQTMTRALDSGPGFFPIRVGAVAAAAFGLLAFALAIVGLYGVTSYLASQRTHEIGIRLAIGATRGQIVRLVAQDGSTLVLLGVALGLVATLACSRVISRFLFSVPAHDPLTLLSVTLVLTVVALLACIIPAWRFARLDPTIALRSE